MGKRAWLRKNPATPLSQADQGRLVKMWETKADNALSKYVREMTLREYGGCPFCGGPIHHCFHFVTRKRRITRWLFINVIGSCKVCNKLERYFPDVSRAWFIKRYGAPVYLDLVRKAQKEWTPRSRMDANEKLAAVRYLKAITEHYKLKLKGLVRIDKG